MLPQELVPPESSFALVAYLAEHGASQLCLSVLQSMKMLEQFGAATMEEQLSLLVTKVLQSDCVDHCLALGYMLALDTKSAFQVYRQQVCECLLHPTFGRVLILITTADPGKHLQGLQTTGTDFKNWQQCCACMESTYFSV